MVHKRIHKFDDKKIWWLRFAKTLLLFFAVIGLLFSVVLGVASVSGTSMYPTFDNGQPVFFFRLQKHYGVGDVISIHMSNGERYIKRVVAVGGDTVDIRDGVLYVNGEPESAAYAYGRTEPQTGVVYPLQLAANQIFALGDNREGSVDSRTFGPLATSQTRGRVLTKK